MGACNVLVLEYYIYRRAKRQRPRFILRRTFCVVSAAESGARESESSSLALPETMDPDQEAQLRQQKEMQRLEARIRDAAARQAMPGAPTEKVESEPERRMRELYEERLREYGDLAGDEEKEEEERYV